MVWMEKSKLSSLQNSRWFVLVASIWVQACAGVGYAFGSYSPLLKSVLGYNQKQINTLGVAKDMGDSVGLLAGTLCEILPSWGMFLLGSVHNLIGYGWLWLIVTARVPSLPFWMICVLICVGTNGETYFNTAALVSCVRNFPKSRGPIVGILKGFTGLCGAIFAQLYATFFAPDQAAFIFMVAVGPAMVACALMFVIRPIEGVGGGTSPALERAESAGFSFIYAVCLVLAAYLMGVMLLQDLVHISESAILVITAILLFLIALPLATPVVTAFFINDEDSNTNRIFSNDFKPVEGSTSGENSEPLLRTCFEEENLLPTSSFYYISEQEDESLPLAVRKQRIEEMQHRLLYAAAEGAVKVKRKKGPRRGQDFTLFQALVKADFWLLFFALFCGAGSGLTVIDNLGQITESQGYDNAHIFVSMISIWNFLGRLAGGYSSEIISKDYALPRPLMMAVAQATMTVGHLFMAFEWPGSLYVGTLLVGVGYGAHWSIVPAAASELFGLKNFGIIYNFITMANPAGSFVFSGILAGTLYDWEAERQHTLNNYVSAASGVPSSSYLWVWADAGKSLQCKGPSCFFLTFICMTVVCIIGIVLTLVLSFRTWAVYHTIYGTSSPDSSSHNRHSNNKKETSTHNTWTGLDN